MMSTALLGIDALLCLAMMALMCLPMTIGMLRRRPLAGINRRISRVGARSAPSGGTCWSSPAQRNLTATSRW